MKSGNQYVIVCSIRKPLKSLHLKINQTDEMRVGLARSSLKCSVKLETKQNKSFINQLYYLQICGDYGLHQSSRANYCIC